MHLTSRQTHYIIQKMAKEHLVDHYEKLSEERKMSKTLKTVSLVTGVLLAICAVANVIVLLLLRR